MVKQNPNNSSGLFLTLDALKARGFHISLPVAEIIWRSSRAFQTDTAEDCAWRQEIIEAAQLNHE